MKPKTIMLMAVAVGCGLMASFATSRYIANAQPQVLAEEEVPVLVAKKTIAAYTPLTDKESFEIKMFRKSDAARDAVADFERVKGKSLKAPLAAGKPLAEADLLAEGDQPLIQKLRKGEVAMAVKVTLDHATAGFILPGHKVDLVATLTRRSDNEQPMAKTILQDIEVLAIDQDINTPDGRVAKNADRVTLRLTHEQAEEVAVYADTGTLRLLLRRPDDVSQYETVGATAQLKGKGNKGPAAPANRNPELSAIPAPSIAPPVLPDQPETVPVPVAKEPEKKADEPQLKRLTIVDANGVKHYDYHEKKADAAGEKDATQDGGDKSPADKKTEPKPSAAKATK